MPKQFIGNLDDLSADDYGTFLGVLKEHRLSTDSALQEHVSTQDGPSNIFEEISMMFTARKQKLLNLQKEIDAGISDKRVQVEGFQKPEEREKKVLLEMDLNYLNMFKRLVSEELVNEETLKKDKLETMMSRFVRTGLHPEN